MCILCEIINGEIFRNYIMKKESYNIDYYKIPERNITLLQALISIHKEYFH